MDRAPVLPCASLDRDRSLGPTKQSVSTVDAARDAAHESIVVVGERFRSQQLIGTRSSRAGATRRATAAPGRRRHPDRVRVLGCEGKPTT